MCSVKMADSRQTLELKVKVIKKEEESLGSDCNHGNQSTLQILEMPSVKLKDGSQTLQLIKEEEESYGMPPEVLEEDRVEDTGDFIHQNRPSPNSVESLLSDSFEQRPLAEKLHVKELGPDRPDVNIQQVNSDRGKRYTRTFSRRWYEKTAWLCASSSLNGLFCFPCLLFGGSDVAWTKTGVSDMKHVAEKIKKHDLGKTHMRNAMKLAMLGRVSIAAQLDESYRIDVRKHNEEVSKNRHVLSKIIDCVKFCGAFELALRGDDETDSSESSGVFRGLVDLVSTLDGAFKEHLAGATGFNGTSKTVQNELLDCMLEVMREYIAAELRSAEFVTIQGDETASVSTPRQLALVFRYVDNAEKVRERFFGFVPLEKSSTDSVAASLLEQLDSIFPNEQRGKIIGQAYDGASVLRGVPNKIQNVYPNAHHIHCYAHQLNLTVQQAASHIPRVRIFFSDLGGFAAFFSRLPERTLVEMVAHGLPRNVRWDVHSCAVKTVFEHRDNLMKCFRAVQSDPCTVREAGGLIRLLEDEEFIFLLDLFHSLMPHVDALSSQLQKPDIDSAYTQRITKSFVDSVRKVRNSVPSICANHTPSLHPAKRQRADQQTDLGMATEACDLILAHAKERFAFTKHLQSATLLRSDLFNSFRLRFPNTALNTTVEAYPMMNKNRLQTELSLVYGDGEFRTCRGAMALLQVLVENDLKDTLSETAKLLRIHITTPTVTAEPERCFSTQKRIKNFLRNSVSQDCLNALAMLSVEKGLTTEIPEFNTRVIEEFASQKQRRRKFMYK